ncbi:hypothetical protein J437_LFUL004263 [Ladona fulva]|uniref:Enolase-phosphatase E1 n=1 Tax=Ladona fulva TaxID=123851 RepID=A0A8K0KDM9_LADFU|nr:hypothetical protein J437_LFUL004263 [Ladona fulva]
MAVDIKHLADYSDKLRNVSKIVTETVGTTTSYTFPEDTLHPYIKKNLKEYIINHWEDEEIQEMVKVLRKQAKTEVEEGWVGAVSIPEGDDVDVKKVKEAVAEYALNQIDSSDLAVLKNRIVKDGYSKGKLQGHLFPDVLPAFKKWIAEGKKIFMYSSGLEMSQTHLVSNSVEGDITELISGCFYSSEFPRTRSESFREMCKKVDCSADKVAFLTDNAQTARAAHKAGLVVIMLCREGNSYMGSSIRESFPVINSFEDISQHICGKRKMSGEEPEDSCGKKPKLDESITEAEKKKEEPTSPIDIIVTPPEEEKKTGASETEKKDDAAKEKMEVDEKADAEAKKPAEDKKEEVSGDKEVKKDVSKVEEVVKEESEVEAMETDGKVSEDKVAEEDKPKEKVEVEASKESEVKVEGAEDKKEDKTEEMKEVAKDGAEEGKSEEKVEESKPEEKSDKKAEEEVAESKEEAQKEGSADEVKESKTEETKPEESKSEKDDEKKSEDVDKKSEETIEETKSEEEVTKSKEVEKKPEESSEVKSAEEKGEEKKPEGEDEVKNNVDEEASADEVIKENGEAEKKVCTNGIDGEETKENGVSSDEKVEVSEAIKAVPKKAELEGSANEAATQESA